MLWVQCTTDVTFHGHCMWPNGQLQPQLNFSQFPTISKSSEIVKDPRILFSVEVFTCISWQNKARAPTCLLVSCRNSGCGDVWCG